MQKFAVFTFVFFASVSSSDRSLADCREMLRDMRSLAEELKGFERSQSFKTYGFGAGGPHATWVERAKELQLKHKTGGPSALKDIVSDDPVFPGDILGLGISKVSCVTTAYCDLELIADVQRRLAKMRCR